MPTLSILHHNAYGIHPGAFVQSDRPDTSDSQNGVLWVDTSIGPPHQLKWWEMETDTWHDIGSVESGVDDTGHLLSECLTLINGATLCNPSTDDVRLHTPTGHFGYDTTGITLPGGHRLEGVIG